MKVAMQYSVSVPANSTIQNVVSGQRYERVPFQAAVGALYTTGSATGLQCELNVGGQSVTPPVDVNTNNRVPLIPDDQTISGWEALQGQLIQLSVTNTTGGALTFRWKIEVEEAQLQAY
jgi:hypothetical protein